ncbi:serine acetyltransferase [Paenibacillus sp. MMS18-CY102]|uniref:serine acetyltransferase n=1 Tax=Paenibacillus sp. MMS18-CY102 TaxID=2682849 RepID=UPI0013664C4C|nr:serine acetyltransferase [Paenibacillus sp. MMS18-CY102]MWC30902.1 serine acetyltransferase [Paenibacillus sp. MMS18-CY102]
MFKLTLTVDELQSYVFHQLNHFFPDKRLSLTEKRFSQSIYQALERTEYCFQHIALKSFHHEGTTFFSHLHSDQYTLFLWFLSNSAWKVYEDTEVASKLFYLNKTLNGVICMYDAGMPDIFLIVHGGGVVLGKASYSDFFVCYQGCTVGAINGVYPVLGKGVAMAPQSSIVGNCTIGNGVTIGNQSLLRNTHLSSGSLYYRHTETGQHHIQPTDKPWAQSFFNVPIPFSGEDL